VREAVSVAPAEAAAAALAIRPSARHPAPGSRAASRRTGRAARTTGPAPANSSRTSDRGERQARWRTASRHASRSSIEAEQVVEVFASESLFAAGVFAQHGRDELLLPELELENLFLDR